jgi:hypothetical protein
MQGGCTVSQNGDKKFLLHQTVRTVLGEQAGDIFMEFLSDDNQDHIKRLGDDLRHEMVELRTELRADMHELQTELRGEMAELKSELRREMAELRIDLERGFRNQTWRMVTALVSSQAVTLTAMGLMFTTMR